MLRKLELWSVFPFKSPPPWLARLRDKGVILVAKSACRRFGAAWYYEGDRGAAENMLKEIGG